MPKHISIDELKKKVCRTHYYLTPKMIDEIPSADVRENIHGEWIYDIDGIDLGIGCWKCSICKAPNENIHEKNNFYANPLRWAGSNFCPNCGADMRERKGDN